MKAYKWGILSTGTIARKFAACLEGMGEEAIGWAVASRGEEGAKAFAGEFGIERAYGSYEALAADPEVDIVYIGTPHSRHYEDILLCLQHGKHVLCEKSFTVNAGQAREVYALAAEKGLFVMEAFWSRFVPGVRKMLELTEGGALGDVRFMTGQFGFAPQGARAVRKMDPALAGGALLDIGVYNIGFACMVFGYAPVALSTVGQLGPEGTDTHSGILLEWPEGRFAQLTTSIGIEVPPRVCVYGTKGRLEIPDFNGAQLVELVLAGQEPQVLDMRHEINGFEYQVREAQACLAAGKLQSGLFGPEKSVAVMALMDEVREKWGLRYPGEG